MRGSELSAGSEWGSFSYFVRRHYLNAYARRMDGR